MTQVILWGYTEHNSRISETISKEAEFAQRDNLGSFTKTGVVRQENVVRKLGELLEISLTLDREISFDHRDIMYTEHADRNTK